jgi:hypothetical protein
MESRRSRIEPAILESELVLLLTLLIFCVVLVVVLWAGSLWLQSWLYNEPAPNLFWGAPAAAGVMTLFLAVWCLLDYKSRDPSTPDPRFDSLFFFGPSQTKVYPLIRSVKNGQETVYQLTNGEFHMMVFPYSKWTVSDEIIVEESGQEDHFKPDRDAKGFYKREPYNPPWGLGWLVGPGPARPLRYYDPRGRVMTEDAVGQVTTFRWGLFLVNLLLNLVHLALWFVCFWLLLRYQWPHALGLAFCLWLLMTVAIIHMLAAMATQKG